MQQFTGNPNYQTSQYLSTIYETKMKYRILQYPQKILKTSIVISSLYAMKQNNQSEHQRWDSRSSLTLKQECLPHYTTKILIHLQLVGFLLPRLSQKKGIHLSLTIKCETQIPEHTSFKKLLIFPFSPPSPIWWHVKGNTNPQKKHTELPKDLILLINLKYLNKKNDGESKISKKIHS